MATQIVMDQTGDTRHEFDPGNAEALARAEQRFRELTGADARPVEDWLEESRASFLAPTPGLPPSAF